MEANLSKSNLKAVVQQVTHNTTSWIGHGRGEAKNHISGQTFTCPATGQLDRIEVFSECVTNNVPVDLSLHSFDIATKNWGPALETSSVQFNTSDTGKWISFPLHGLLLSAGKAYGFKLKCDAALIGVGEAAGAVNQVTKFSGQEWSADSDDQLGNYYSYLSLAFKVALRA
jgi:hypothetical protein